MLASLIGAGASSLLGEQTPRDRGWRIPFLVGGLLGFVGLYLRRGLAETGPFTSGRAEAVPRSPRALLPGLAGNNTALARIVGLSPGVTVVYYVWAVGVSAFAISAKGAPRRPWCSGPGVLAIAMFMITLPPLGALSDT
ncbi:hypothetical protein [Pseudonocardia acaciae]|uniref:hypothetical protein n=1 Tax=Pseudonocardia acaciae TaxID=551276 RepID=UPI00048E282D|nr:hypothetical protein [Pseudonocardia acaciae]